MPSFGDGGCLTARSMISAAQPYDFPDPTGPINPRTNESSCKNFQVVGAPEKSRSRPPRMSSEEVLLVFFCLLLLVDLWLWSVALLVRAIF